MNVLQTIFEALESLNSNKMRSGLTVLGIVIGVAAVIAMMAIGSGVQDTITGEIEGIGTNLIFISPGNQQVELRNPQPLTLGDAEALAAALGFPKVSELKLAVAQRIKEYTAGGGFLFTMCSGTDTYDIALAAHNTDICESMYDGDPADPAAQSKLEFDKTFAFHNFILETDPLIYEFSSIDATDIHTKVPQTQDFFTLFDFSAKWDIVPTMLNQNHRSVIKGFMGQTTAFKKQYIKSEVLILGESKAQGSVKYIHGEFGKGQWTFYGGHDPEDYQHRVGDPPTDLNLHPNSPGYRLILNNILFPAAKKKHQKT